MPRQHGRCAPRVLIVGCGALASELVALTRDLPNVDITCLPRHAPQPARRHPGRGARRGSARRRTGYDRVFVAYADCGTGGLLDPVIAEEGVERLAGAHCYEFYAGREAFERSSAEELGTFYLTDFLARNFDRLVIGAPGPGPPPRAARRRTSATTVGSSTSPRPRTRRSSAPRAAAADRLGLAFERRQTGYGELATTIAAVAAGEPAPPVIPLLSGGR